ncbi:MAG: hypothetical protein VW405_00325 [Rhodospirillaceae bacterium]
MTKRPSFQFYPGDWRSDPKLRSVPLAARGLWLELLCLMHEGEPYGHLTTHGIDGANPRQIGRIVAADPRTVTSQLCTLLEYGIVSQTDTGTLYSKRMVEDEKRRLATAKRVSLHRERSGVTPDVTGRVTPEKRPSSSSSSSSGTKVPLKNPPTPRKRGARPRPDWQSVLARDEYAPLRESVPFLKAWDDWIAHASEPGSRAKVPAGKQAATLLNRALPDVAAFAAAVDDSIANNWQGVNPAWNRGGGGASKPDPLEEARRRWGEGAA